MGCFYILFVATAATAATERVLNAGLCAGARRVRFRYVHVPKSGGMTLTCTLDSEYRRGLLPCHQLKNFHVPVELEARHRTYDEYLLEAGAIGAADDGAVGGASAAAPIDADGVCLPLITMLAPQSSVSSRRSTTGRPRASALGIRRATSSRAGRARR